MHPIKFLSACLVMIVLSTSFFACTGNENYTPIPNVYVYKQIDLNDPRNIQLNAYGSYMYLDDIGSKGVILYHDFSDNYHAIERTCSYEPTNPCAKVEVDVNGLLMQCGHTDSSNYTACCDSKFLWDTYPTSGPATYPLKEYLVNKSGNILVISN